MRFCGAIVRSLLVAVFAAKAGITDDAEQLAKLLGAPVPASGAVQPPLLRAARLLAEQVHGIDYASLGLGWEHPQTRIEFREHNQGSFQKPKSLARTAASTKALAKLCGSGAGLTEEAIVSAFVREIGAGPKVAKGANFPAVLAALEAELLLPLRALNEGGESLHTTFGGDPLPAEQIDRAVGEITKHVLRGDFSQWRYTNAVGRRQLEGLTDAQIALWSEPSRTDFDGLVVHEDEPGELGFFWATKIGGPSHGFDVEGQCLLPLLANARHKVVLVSDPDWPAHPAGRAHFRMLWTNEAEPRPRLWLETVNCDFAACRRISPSKWRHPVLRHVLSKAAAMGVSASFEAGLQRDVEEVARAIQLKGSAQVISEKLVLRPSNAVVEASDYLSNKHDWVQTEEEVTAPLRRCVFTPSLKRSSEL